MDTIPTEDLQARALANLRMNSGNSFVFIPKRKASGTPPAEGRQSVGPPEGEAGWASLRHQEHEAQLVPGADGVCAGGRSPLGVEQGGCPRPATALVDRAVRCQRPSSPPPSPLAATEAEPAQGFKVPSLAKNGRESGRPGLPVTFIDEVDSEDEVPQEAKLPCSGASAPPQYHPHPSGPGHLAELQHRTGNTFTVVPKRKPVALQANGEARPREAEEEGPGGLSEPPAALGPSLKKRYPTVHEIEVIGGYLALQKSCLTKAGSSRKKGCFVAWNPLPTRKSSSDSSRSFWRLAPSTRVWPWGQIPRPAPCDSHQQAHWAGGCTSPWNQGGGWQALLCWLLASRLIPLRVRVRVRPLLPPSLGFLGAVGGGDVPCVTEAPLPAGPRC
uniref:Phostensin/Taperin PP1-binding domain-containing protein n=1 Tax=Sus scrofa TaxID=9823 RepID=A0A8D1M4N4_PIG